MCLYKARLHQSLFHSVIRPLTQPPQGSPRPRYGQRWIYSHSPLVHSTRTVKINTSSLHIRRGAGGKRGQSDGLYLE